MPKHLLIQRWLLVLACVGCALKVNAHDIPNKIDLQAFVKAERDTVEMTVRIPLVMLLNLNLPKDGRGFLALDLLEPGLRKAADATASEIELSLAGQPLTYRVAQTRISLPSDESFGSHAEAKARIQGDALPASKKVFWNQGYFDAYYEYSAPPDANDLAVRLQIAPGMKTSCGCTYVSLMPKVRFVLTRLATTTAGSTWIRVGCELQRPSFDWEPRTFSMDRITCCSCYAWLCPFP